MSFDVQLIRLDCPDDEVTVGNFPSEVLTIWNAAYLRYTNSKTSDFTVVNGGGTQFALRVIPEMIALLIKSNGHYIYPSDYYQEAAIALVALWKACRENPHHTVIINY